jgi:single-strand DNA-binding protein
MSGSVNKVILVGHLGSDPEMRQLPSGGMMAKFNVATSETWNDKNTGQRVDKTEWHKIVVMDPKLAQICERYLTKGQLVYLEGSIQTRSWDDKESGQKRYMTEIKAREMRMLGGRREGAAAAPGGASEPPPGPGPAPENDDDVPF